MPEISRFYGIVIRMYFDDHNPPHFHALYGDDEAWISINNLALMYGNIPSRALGMVIEWASLHQEELRQNWALLAEEQRPNKIAPLK
jgi:hypothetical protein